MSSSTGPTSSPTVTSSAIPTCIDVPAGRHDYVPAYACGALWNYDVSFPAALAFAVLFGVITMAHLVLGVTFKKRFAWVILMGCSWETIAFALRSVSALHQKNIAVATVAQLLVLLAPLWINAFVYMILGRMIYFFIPDKSCFGIKATRLAKIFVWLDVFSFIVQVGGGVLITPDQKPDIMNIGIKVYETGVGIQELFVVIFTCVAIRFNKHMLDLQRQGLAKRGWKRLLATCYIVLALITVRIVYRLIELNGGVSNDGTNALLFHEYYFYCLEAGPMMLAGLLLAIVHPGFVLKGEDSEFPRYTRKERKAMKKAKKEAKKEEKEAKKMAKQMGYAYNESNAEKGLTLAPSYSN